MQTTQLSILLANTYALYLKTQNYHWNVTGVHFASLHSLFEQQYEELSESVDAIAEHIRMLGEHVPASFNAFQKLNKIPDGQVHLDAAGMIADLLTSHTLLIDLLTTALKEAQQAQDEVIADFFIERMSAHRKYQWMLRSLKS
jgi:starvation-inducible DNA-binding protein